MGKLTKAQKRELRELADHSPLSYDDRYKPIQRLLELGFAEQEPGKFGTLWCSITPAGRLALSTGGRS